LYLAYARFSHLLVAESPEELQKMFDLMGQYAEEWQAKARLWLLEQQVVVKSGGSMGRR